MESTLFTISIVIISLYSTFSTNALSEDYDFSRRMVQFIVDHKMTDLFQRFGSRVVLLDGTKKATIMFERLLEHLPGPTIILEKKHKVLNMNQMNSPSIAFIFLEDEKEIKGAIEHLQNSEIYQGNTPTVMVKLSQVKDIKKFDVYSVMKLAWSLGLARFLLIYSDSTIRAISYNPFRNSLVNVSNQTGNALFPRHLNNLHRYLWKVSLFEEWPLLRKMKGKRHSSHSWFGRDFTLLEEVARIMNATFTVVEPPPHSGYKGAIKDILEKKVDFCFVRRFPEDNIKSIRFVNTGSLTSLSVIVGRPAYQEQPTAILLVFSEEIWLCLALAVIALVSTMRLLQVKNTYHSVQTSFLDIWRVLLNISLQSTARQRYTSIIPLAAWIWSSLILSASFQCRLIDLMKYPQSQEGIQSLKELEKSKLPVYSSFDYVKMQGDRGYLRNQMNLVKYQEILKRLDEPISSVVMPFVVVRERTSLEFLEYLESRHKAILKESLVKGYAVYAFPYFSPFNNAVYVAIMRMTEYGLMNKLPKSLRDGAKNKIVIKRTFSLNLKHVVSAFYFLYIGLTLGLILFILELLIGSKGRK